MDEWLHTPIMKNYFSIIQTHAFVIDILLCDTYNE